MTSDKRTIADLIERLEKAEGPDRELDLEIARLQDAVVMRRNDDDTGNEEFTHWHYTAKIDDALSLVPEGWFVHMSRFSTGHAPRCDAHVFREPDISLPVEFGGFDHFEADAPTLALAFCIAAIKARASA